MGERVNQVLVGAAMRSQLPNFARKGRYTEERFIQKRNVLLKRKRG